MNEIEKRGRELLEEAMGCALEHNLSGQVSVAAAMHATVAALSAAHAAMSFDVLRDAERYRWLRSLPVDAADRDGLDVVLWVDALGGFPRGENLDAEIDAAMLAAKAEHSA